MVFASPYQCLLQAGGTSFGAVLLSDASDVEPSVDPEFEPGFVRGPPLRIVFRCWLRSRLIASIWSHSYAASVFSLPDVKSCEHRSVALRKPLVLQFPDAFPYNVYVYVYWVSHGFSSLFCYFYDVRYKLVPLS